MIRLLPGWAAWKVQDGAHPWTVGIEEEVMLLDPQSWGLASRIDDVLAALPHDMAASASAETHDSAIELSTQPHETVGDAARDLSDLRSRLAAALDDLGLRAAVAGTHPTAQWTDTRIASGARYRAIHDSMRELARREPTFALHVHVAVPDAERAVTALGRLRVHLPLLLALSANSPFWQGRDSGLASVRTPVFGEFPRTGIPRHFGNYREYVEAIDVLLRCDAFPEPTFLWWDIRLQPRLGTIEIRIMDAQTRVRDLAALAAVVQCLVRLEATEGFADDELAEMPEVLDENRFLATRDGMDALLLDPAHGARRPVRDYLDAVLAACAPHAEALGCMCELRSVETLAGNPGYERQRALARRTLEETAVRGMAGVTRELSAAFTRDAALTA
jgi:carboxylate-amine ligase